MGSKVNIYMENLLTEMMIFNQDVVIIGLHPEDSCPVGLSQDVLLSNYY